MISPSSHSKDWISQLWKNGLDPELTEKMILAFILVESLQRSGLKFTFKGGSSLSLITGTLCRFSIDADIIVPPDTELEPFFKQIILQGVFFDFNEAIRKIDIPARHFRFFYKSTSNDDNFILIDVLFENNPYPYTVEKPIISPLLQVSGEPTKVLCPTLECLLGDKLTAFAPHTTGVQFKVDKDLEIVKQLFDVGTLFDYAIMIDGSLKRIFEAHANIAVKELEYRKIMSSSQMDVLKDTFNTSCMIGTYGKIGGLEEFAEIASGISKFKHYIFSGSFSMEAVILSAAKAACLAAAGISKIPSIQRFDASVPPSIGLIKNPDFNKLNRVRNLGPEPFYYFCQGLDMLGLI